MSILQELLLTGESATVTIEITCRNCSGKGYVGAQYRSDPLRIACGRCWGNRVVKHRIPLKEFVDFIRNT